MTKLLATFFFVGYMPIAPGTFGSFLGLLLFAGIRQDLRLFGFGLLLVVALLSCGRAEKLFRRKDPPQVVIDEVCGMFLTLLFVPFTLFNLTVGFLLFRVLDIIKPFPANRFEKLRGSAGILLDDLAAGVYAGLILLILGRVL